MFDITEVEAFFARSRSTRQDPLGDGEIAAEVFALLDDGLNSVDVVRRTRVAPDIVEHLQRQWARMRRSLLLAPDARARLERALLGEVCFGPDAWSLETADDLETALKEAAQPTECAMCHHTSAVLCRACAKDFVVRASAPAR